MMLTMIDEEIASSKKYDQRMPKLLRSAILHVKGED